VAYSIKYVLTVLSRRLFNPGLHAAYNDYGLNVFVAFLIAKVFVLAAIVVHRREKGDVYTAIARRVSLRLLCRRI